MSKNAIMEKYVRLQGQKLLDERKKEGDRDINQNRTDQLERLSESEQLKRQSLAQAADKKRKEEESRRKEEEEKEKEKEKKKLQNEKEEDADQNALSNLRKDLKTQKKALKSNSPQPGSSGLQNLGAIPKKKKKNTTRPKVWMSQVVSDADMTLDERGKMQNLMSIKNKQESQVNEKTKEIDERRKELNRLNKKKASKESKAAERGALNIEIGKLEGSRGRAQERLNKVDSELEYYDQRTQAINERKHLEAQERMEARQAIEEQGKQASRQHLIEQKLSLSQIRSENEQDYARFLARQKEYEEEHKAVRKARKAVERECKSVEKELKVTKTFKKQSKKEFDKSVNDVVIVEQEAAAAAEEYRKKIRQLQEHKHEMSEGIAVADDKLAELTTTLNALDDRRRLVHGREKQLAGLINTNKQHISLASKTRDKLAKQEKEAGKQLSRLRGIKVEEEEEDPQHLYIEMAPKKKVRKIESSSEPVPLITPKEATQICPGKAVARKSTSKFKRSKAPVQQQRQPDSTVQEVTVDKVDQTKGKAKASKKKKKATYNVKKSTVAPVRQQRSKVTSKPLRAKSPVQQHRQPESTFSQPLGAESPVQQHIQPDSTVQEVTVDKVDQTKGKAKASRKKKKATYNVKKSTIAPVQKQRV